MKKVIIVLALALFCAGLSYAQTQTTADVPQEKRGCFIELPKFAAKKIKKGAMVDVVITFKAILKGDNTPQYMSATILQTMPVLDSGVEDGKGFIIISATPEEAQYLFLSQAEGTVNVVLRNDKDTTVNKVRISTMKTLFN